MGNRCEWKDGKFVGCESMGDRGQGLMVAGFNFCPFCGAGIRKPEPEKPLIVRSGGTWVAHFEGVDYLCILPENLENELRVKNDFDYCIIKGKYHSKWIPFSEITLTDEIAKLRPMVISRSIKDESVKLYGIEGDGIILVRHVTDKSRYRLATPKELQEASNGEQQ